MDIIEYPKMVYKKGENPVTVHDKKEEDKLTSDGWGLKPVADTHERGDAVVHPNDGKEIIPSAATKIDEANKVAKEAEEKHLQKTSGDGLDAGDWTASGFDKDGFPVKKGSANDVSRPPVADSNIKTGADPKLGTDETKGIKDK